MKILKVPVVQLSILSLVMFALAFLFNISAAAPLKLLFDENTSLLIFSLASTGLAFMFFGYGAPVMAFFGGLYTALFYTNSFWMAASAALITLIVGWASIRIGTALLHDLQGKSNFREAWKQTAVFIAAAVMLGILWTFA